MELSDNLVSGSGLSMWVREKDIKENSKFDA